MEQERKRTILLVDDSETVLIMEEMLLRRSYDILKAASGAQALRLAAEKRPDLILLDVVMPDMNGLETCRLLRGMEATKTTPIIMVTTRSEAATVSAAQANGANDYVTKPIDRKELMEKVSRHIGGGT
jgi:PleD family two-component response regulator